LANLPPKKPPGIPTGGARKFSKTRWLYQLNGRDIGPFTPSEIQDLMRKGELDTDTRVRLTSGQQWKPAGQIPEFSKFYEKVLFERNKAAQERALDAAENAVRDNRKLPLYIARSVTGLLIIVGLTFGYTRWQAQHGTTPSGFTDSLVKSLDINTVAARAYLDTAGQIQWPSELVGQRAAKKGKRTRSRATGGKTLPTRSRTADDLTPQKTAVTDFSFDSRTRTGRELSRADIRKVRGAIVPKLVRCAQREANRKAGFPGTTVSFSIRPSGAVGRVRVGANGRRSGSFTACAKRAVNGVRVAPFDGGARTITVPLKVGK